MTLTEFLTARLDEDAAEAVTVTDPRPLREVEAKRAIVELHAPTAEPPRCEHVRPMPPACQECGTGQDRGLCVTFRTLATVYADHPDYDEEWRP